MDFEYINNDTFVDYEIFYHDGMPFRGPKPSTLEKGAYITCIGASQTFGRFCPKPYPQILSERLGMPVLNMGWGGLGLRFYANDEKRMRLINDSALVIVQATSARCESNSRGTSNGTAYVQDNVTGKGGHSNDLLQRLIDEQVHPSEIICLARESSTSYIRSHRDFYNQLKVPSIFFYFSKVDPENNTIQGFGSPVEIEGEFPHWVNSEVYQALTNIFPECVKCITSRGLPETLPNGNTNNYYFSQAMQRDAAEALEPKVASTIEKESTLGAFISRRKSLNIPLWLISEPRSGSTLLANVLNNLMLSNAEPKFSEHIRRTKDEAQLRLKRTKAIYGFWQLHYQPEDILKVINNYPRIKFIHTYRTDKVAQAVSMYIGEKTGVWHIKSDTKKGFDGKPVPETVPFDIERLDSLYRFYKYARQWYKELNLIEPDNFISLEYNEICHSTLDSVKSVMHFLGIDFSDEEIQNAIDAVPIIPTARPEYQVFKDALLERYSVTPL